MLKITRRQQRLRANFSHIYQMRFVKESGQKLSTLSRIIPFVDFSFKKKANDFFLSQFSYCQPVWMSHSD